MLLDETLCTKVLVFIKWLYGDVCKRDMSLKLSCYKKWQKSPGQETGLGNRGRLMVLNDTKLILND